MPDVLAETFEVHDAVLLGTVFSSHVPRQFFRNFLPTLEQGGWITPEDSEAFWRAWEIADRNPASFIYLPPMVDIIAVKK